MASDTGCSDELNPLYRAMLDGDSVTFETQLRAGADPDMEIVIGNERETPLLLALSCPEEYARFVPILLKYGADVNRNIGPWHPLTTAFPDIEVVEALLRAGANPNIRGLHGRTALMNAIENGLVDIARLLLKYGAHPSTGNVGVTGTTLV